MAIFTLNLPLALGATPLVADYRDRDCPERSRLEDCGRVLLCLE